MSSGISVGVPVGPMTTTGSPGCRYAHSRLDTPISRVISERRPGFAIHPCAGERHALHQQRGAMAVGPHVRAQSLEVLQPVELPGMEMTRGGRRADDHLYNRRRQADHPLDRREELIVQT